MHFANFNDASHPTLQVGSTGAYPIRYASGSVPLGGDCSTWRTDETVLFCFSSRFKYWRMLKDVSMYITPDGLFIEF